MTKSISLKVFTVQAETINTKAQNILWSFIDDSNLAEDSEKAPVLHFLIKREKIMSFSFGHMRWTYKYLKTNKNVKCKV